MAPGRGLAKGPAGSGGPAQTWACRPSPTCLHLLCRIDFRHPMFPAGGDSEKRHSWATAARLMSAPTTAQWTEVGRAARMPQKESSALEGGTRALGFLGGAPEPGLEGGEGAFGDKARRVWVAPSGPAHDSAWLKRGPGRCVWVPDSETTAGSAHGDGGSIFLGATRQVK